MVLSYWWILYKVRFGVPNKSEMTNHLIVGGDFLFRFIHRWYYKWHIVFGTGSCKAGFGKTSLMSIVLQEKRKLGKKVNSRKKFIERHTAMSVLLHLYNRSLPPDDLPLIVGKLPNIGKSTSNGLTCIELFTLRLNNHFAHYQGYIVVESDFFDVSYKRRIS
jgi:hypothetical protein